MIKSSDIFEEVQKALTEVEKDGSVYEKAQIRLLSIVVKLLHNVRTNQTEVMKKQGVELKKPEDQEGQEGQEEKE